MLICRVTGNIISTRKHRLLTGSKFLVVQPIGKDESFVAVDEIGAGVNEMVLVVLGSGARNATTHDVLPIDAAIVGIIDEGTYTP